MKKITGTQKTFTVLKVLLVTILFTSGQAFAWTKTATFESGTVGSAAQGTSGFDNIYGGTVFSSDMASLGTKSAKLPWSLGEISEGGGFAFPQNVTDGTEVWARADYYFKSPWSWTCSPVIKLLRGVHVQNSAGSNVGWLSVFANSNGSISPSNEPAGVQVYTNTTFDVDKWQSIEMYVKLSSTAPVFRVWKNGVLVYEDKTNKTFNSSTDYGDSSLVMSYWNGDSPQNQTQYVDNYIVTTDKPSQVDSNGNPMIGIVNGSTTTTLAAPTGLLVTAK